MRRFGQHYMKRSALNYIVSLLGDINGMVIFEIGCGPGNLTRMLVKKGAHVIGVELDQKFIPVLKKIENLTLIIGDAAKIKFPLCDLVVGNIPYSITSPVLRNLTKSDVTRAVLTMQAEVAKRLIAQPGEKTYGSLTVAMYGWKIKIVKILSPRFFTPPPNVNSAIVVFSRKARLPPLWKKVETDPHFEAFVKKLFAMRRKKLKNILSVNDPRRPFMLDPEELAKIYIETKDAHSL